MKTFYHNLTKAVLNEPTLIDFLESVDDGDLVYFSRTGNALLYNIEKRDPKTESEGEFSHVRKEYNDYKSRVQCFECLDMITKEESKMFGRFCEGCYAESVQNPINKQR